MTAMCLKACSGMHAALPVCMVPSSQMQEQLCTTTIRMYMSKSYTCYMSLDMSGILVVDS